MQFINFILAKIKIIVYTSYKLIIQLPLSGYVSIEAFVSNIYFTCESYFYFFTKLTSKLV